MIPSIILNNGNRIPQIGLGTAGITVNNTMNVISTSYSAGYRLIDTAPNYNNDLNIGEAINTLSLNREDLFISEKVDSHQMYSNINKVCDTCLKRLNTDYIDLYLMHWPFPKYYVKVWLQMEKLLEEGMVKNIGVCNFMPHHMKLLLDKAHIIPVVNQIEMHPLFTQSNVVQYCNQHDIRIMAYAPLARMHAALINNPYLLFLAKKYNKTVPQIILRWDIQNGYIVIPKSENPVRINQNIDIFNFCLSNEEMNVITSLNMDLRVRFDPDDLSRYPKRWKMVVNKVISYPKSLVK